jgi:hypothetical protein
LKEMIRPIELKSPRQLSIQNDRLLDKEFLSSQNLMMVSLESWKNLVDSKSLWLSDIPSTLIVKETM